VTTATATTVYAIGRCPRKGCKTRPRRNTFPGQIVTDRYGTRTRWWITTECGEESPHCRWLPPSIGYAKVDFDVAWVEAMLGYGWVCLEHDLLMKITTVRGTVNEQKVCNARCMGAVGPSCECSCGGALHGGSYDA
jgi:hypothetical protein